ncbi:hypothetical protein B2K_02135 [Paenibacillus mucilaginosus K02]|uniref:Uncharacterized protein n=1 Tax=Paenibacillus mucilaginosus K02 TaxID=997761 RepID=I0BAY5_9BACL|nr:hypothetical protein B2K_02135 [Paenibacillus mucilaginosus K02]
MLRIKVQAQRGADRLKYAAWGDPHEIDWKGKLLGRNPKGFFAVGLLRPLQVPPPPGRWAAGG